MAHFKKQILGVGTLYTGDGERLDITTDRLKHWDTQFKRLKENKQRSTVHLNHPADVNAMLPVDAKKFKKARGAHDLVGELVSFELAEDGQSAILTTDLFDEQAIKAAESDKVQLSPVILETFQDGAKNQYEDIVCGADLVIRPVDHRQGSFEPVGAIACALSLSATKKPKVYLMAFGDDEEKDPEEKDAPAVDGDGDGEVNEEPTETEDAELTGRNAKVAKAVASLAGFGVTLAEDTDASNFWERLDAAVTALQAAKEEEGADDNSKPEEAPMVATMSLESKTALTWANTQYRKTLEARVEALVKSGRCTPHEQKERCKSLGVVSLSLDAAGKPKTNSLEAWIADRETLPVGAVHPAVDRATLLSLREVSPPKISDELDKSEEDAAVEFAFGKR